MASRTSSSLNGLMMAVINFHAISPILVVPADKGKYCARKSIFFLFMQLLINPQPWSAEACPIWAGLRQRCAPPLVQSGRQKNGRERDGAQDSKVCGLLLLFNKRTSLADNPS